MRRFFVPFFSPIEYICMYYVHMYVRIFTNESVYQRSFLFERKILLFFINFFRLYSVLSQLSLSYDEDETNTWEGSERNETTQGLQLHTQHDQEMQQLQLQQREREQLLQAQQHREKTQQHQPRDQQREREREQLHQLQSINNLLLDLPTTSNLYPNYSHDASYSQSTKSPNIEGELTYFQIFD